jgi:hypothetical protein
VWVKCRRARPIERTANGATAHRHSTRGHKTVRRKILQDFANTLCQMLVGWRMGDDLEALAALPDGTLTIDVLSGTACHSSEAVLELHVTDELQAWLLHRLTASRIEPSAVCHAVVMADIRTDRIATNRKRIISFDFAVEAVIRTSEREYRGELHEVHKWHTRVASNKSMKPTYGDVRG